MIFYIYFKSQNSRCLVHSPKNFIPYIISVRFVFLMYRKNVAFILWVLFELLFLLWAVIVNLGE